MEELTRKEVLKNLNDEITNIKECQKGDENGTIEDNENFREPLSIENTTEIKVLLSWGGGEDGYKLRFEDGDLLSGVYYMANWGTYNEMELNEEELNLIYEVYLYSEFPEDLK